MKKAVAIGVASFGLGMAATALVAVNPGGWQWPARLAAALQEPPGPTAAESADTSPPGDDREILYWRAPMDPTFTSDRPGRSPMGMDLVPVYASRAEPCRPARFESTPASCRASASAPSRSPGATSRRPSAPSAPSRTMTGRSPG